MSVSEKRNLWDFISPSRQSSTLCTFPCKNIYPVISRRLCDVWEALVTWAGAACGPGHTAVGGWRSTGNGLLEVIFQHFCIQIVLSEKKAYRQCRGMTLNHSKNVLSSLSSNVIFKVSFHKKQAGVLRGLSDLISAVWETMEGFWNQHWAVHLFFLHVYPDCKLFLGMASFCKIHCWIGKFVNISHKVPSAGTLYWQLEKFTLDFFVYYIPLKCEKKAWELQFKLSCHHLAV